MEEPQIGGDGAKPPHLSALVTYIRYRIDLIELYVSFVKLPNPLEMWGLILGVVSAWALISALVAYVSGTGLAVFLSLLLLTIAAFLMYVARRATIANIFRLSAKDDRLVERLRTLMIQGMQNESPYRLLWALYEPLVAEANKNLHDRSFLAIKNADTGEYALAVALPSESVDQMDDLITLIGGNSAGGQHAAQWGKVSDSRQLFMSALRRVDGFENPWGDEAGDNVVMKKLSLRRDGALQMDAGIATYGEVVRTCDSLVNEFAVFSYLAGHAKRSGRSHYWSTSHLLRALPWRRRAHLWAGGAVPLLLGPSSRAAAVGVAMTMLPENGRQVYVARRSPKVGTYPDAVHVLPAGMCNAKESLRHQGARLRADFLKWTMMGELLEECYDVKEMASYSTDDWVADIREELQKRGLSGLDPHFSGVTIDLLNLRPEICAVVPTQPRTVDSGRLRLCWEYSPHEQVRALSLMSPSYESLVNFVQAGVGALALATGHLEKFETSGRRDEAT